MTQSDLIQQAIRLEFTRLDDSFLAVDAQAGLCYSFTATGARIWSLIEQPNSIEKICAQLREEYNVDEAACLKQVLGFLEQIQAAALIKVNNEVAVLTA